MHLRLGLGRPLRDLRNLSAGLSAVWAKSRRRRTIFIFIRCRRTQNGRKLPPKCGSTEAAPHARSFLIRREDLFIKRIFTARRSSERSGFPLKIHSSGIRRFRQAAALFVSADRRRGTGRFLPLRRSDGPHRAAVDLPGSAAYDLCRRRRIPKAERNMISTKLFPASGL